MCDLSDVQVSATVYYKRIFFYLEGSDLFSEQLDNHQTGCVTFTDSRLELVVSYDDSTVRQCCSQ